MIKAGIAGGLSSKAGEVIKLLVNHPDVEIMWVENKSMRGHLLHEIHKGLLGETYMRFTDAPDVDAVNVIFLCHNDPDDAAEFLHKVNIPDGVKMIDMSGLFIEPDDTESPWVYGLPELNRKPLVRGATRSSIPGPLSTAVLLGLLPLAKNLLLNADIHISAVMPDADTEPGAALALIESEEAGEVSDVLRTLQHSFSRPIFYVLTAGGWTRGLSLVMYLKCNVSEKELMTLYQDYYADHGFTFVSDSVPSLSEVVGTGKCIINLRKVEDRLVICVVIDDALKGSAAQAVHNMNLLFGLQERVGLMLIAAK